MVRAAMALLHPFVSSWCGPDFICPASRAIEVNRPYPDDFDASRIGSGDDTVLVQFSGLAGKLCASNWRSQNRTRPRWFPCCFDSLPIAVERLRGADARR